jgi:hypothetical protein
MTQLPVQPPAVTFVIRIWLEWSLSGPRWRGRIEHLESGQHTAFENLDRILVFIRASGVFTGEQPGEPGDETSEL